MFAFWGQQNGLELKYIFYSTSIPFLYNAYSICKWWYICYNYHSDKMFNLKAVS